MKEWIIWFMTPIPYGCLLYFMGLITGCLVGHTAKTRPYEIQRDEARRELYAALRTIELKQNTGSVT